MSGPENVLNGLIRCKNGIVKMEAGPDTYVVDNLIEMQITVNFTKESIPQLSNMVTQQYLTGMNYTGMLSAYVCSGIANRITDYIESQGDVPPITVVGALVDPINSALGMDGKPSVARASINQQVVKAEGVIPDSLQLIRVASSESDVFWKYEMPFSANKVTTNQYLMESAETANKWNDFRTKRFKEKLNSSVNFKAA
jgi:hypothetical protein